MTAASIAEMLQGRPAGRGKWKAKCPAHPDRHPSLAITQGRNAVLLKCWSRGCDVKDIVTALGLPISALFNDGGLAPVQRRKAKEELSRRESEDKLRRQADRASRDRCRKLERVCYALAATLAHMPDGNDGDALARLYHDSLAKLHSAEATLGRAL
jgi:hypothetical protein